MKREQGETVNQTSHHIFLQLKHKSLHADTSVGQLTKEVYKISMLLLEEKLETAFDLNYNKMEKLEKTIELLIKCFAMLFNMIA